MVAIKKALKILLLILCALILVVGVFAFTQRNNLSALHLAMHHTESEVTAEMQNAEQNVALALDIDLDKVKAEASEIYETEVAEETAAEQALPSRAEPQPIPAVPEPSPTEGSAEADKIEQTAGKDKPDAPHKTDAEVEALIRQFYVLKARFLGRLSAIEASASQRYYALAPKDRTKRALASIIGGCVSQAGALEGQCDSEVHSLLGELKTLLKKSGGDLSIVSEIESCYASEKSLKKAEYMSKYINYLS